MALEKTRQAQGESAHYQKARPAALPFTIGGGLSITLLVTAMLFFGLGFRLSFTHGDSMEPNYHGGSLVIEREVNPDSLKVGDVISFYAPWAEAYVMHRIVRIHTRDGQLWFRTRGDNNPVADPEEVTFQDENPRKILLALPGGLEVAGAIAIVVLGLLAIRLISGLADESG